MSKVARLFKSFQYEQSMVCSCDKEQNDSLAVHTVPRAWLAELENELCALAGVRQDNKTGFVFEAADQPGYAVMIVFWDSTARFIDWSPRGWDNEVPANIAVCLVPFSGHGGTRPSARDLGIPADF